MDALALLCNLYGDGPATLKRLRVSGVLRIEDLSDKRAAELAALLSLTPATARRFLKEASGLRKRVLDGDESAQPSPASSARPRAAREVARGRQAILDAASKRWDELDRTSPAVSEQEATPVVGEPRALATPLAAAQFDRTTHDALEKAGVQTLEELIASDSESLAHAADLGVSQVLFAQNLARRMARESGVSVELGAEKLAVHVLQPSQRSAPRNDARFSPSERPPMEWLASASAAPSEAATQPADEGAGPFA